MLARSFCLRLVLITALVAACIDFAFLPQVATADDGDVLTCPGAQLAFPIKSGTLGWAYALPPEFHDDRYQSSGDYRHTGIDVWASGGAGTPVYSPVAGTVGRSPNSHAFYLDADRVSLYLAHVRPAISEGDPVRQGQFLGYTSDDGHIHISVGARGFSDAVFNSTVDPSSYFAARLSHPTAPAYGTQLVDTCTSPWAPPPSSPTGTLLTTPAFDRAGNASVVFGGGTIESLEKAAKAAGASGAWVQDVLGRFRQVIVDGPSFLRDQLRKFFPNGTLGTSAVTLRRASNTSPPTTSVPIPAPTQPPRVVPILVPPTPTPLSPSGSAIGSGARVVLMWSGVSGAATYDMEVWGGPYTTMTACSGTAATTCAIGPMWDGGPYFWRVRARNSAGVSAWSSTVSFSVGAAPVVDNIPSGITPPPYRPTHPGHEVSIGGQHFKSDDGKTWRYTGPDKPTACSPSSNGVVLYRDTDFRPNGGCIFTTADIPDLQPAGYDRGVTSLQFLGSYIGHYQVLIYRQANYQDLCGSYWQDQSDLRNCAGQAMSIQIRTYAAPAPIPTPSGATLVGNIAPMASLSTDANPAIDGSLGTQWIGGHKFRLTLTWSEPATIRRVVIWDRTQSDSDNNQINLLQLRFSDGSVIAPMDMTSGGPRCIDVTFSPKTVTSMTVEPFDASGRNGLREIEVWSTTGSQNSSNNCVMKLSR